MQYAQINLDDWTVTHVIELDSTPIQPGAVLVPVPVGKTADVGQIFDSLNLEFVAGPTARRLTQFEFFSRVGLPVLSVVLPAVAADGEVAAAWAFATNSQFIDLDLPMTADLLGLLVYKGLLTAEQRQTLLDGGSL